MIQALATYDELSAEIYRLHGMIEDAIAHLSRGTPESIADRDQDALKALHVLLDAIDGD
jgi:hypothetical protein